MLTRFSAALAVLLGVTPVYAVNEDLFEDEDGGTHEYRAVPGSRWKELETPLPEYPRPENLVELDISDYDFPFAVFIDKTSVSVEKDRIVRYTVVLRSSSGSDNVSYEGIQCNQRRVKRYGFGSGGRLVKANGAEWRFIRPIRQDSHRNLLVNDVFCPLPMGNVEREIGIRLKENSVLSEDFVFPGDDE